ncbi:orotidine-5'-phosphate decarboxylase [bacterium]|nr:MAG: orotidine-5'-phosphate decarboxylase [bacterium]
MNYIEKLTRAAKDADSLLCIGLDPDVQKIKECFPSASGSDEDLVTRFCLEVIDLTQQYACAFKPNLAFFEALGKNGLHVFKTVVDHIPRNKIIIADAKRGDIGNTASHYAKAFFEEFYVDALTVNPLMGMDTIDPYINYPGKAIYVLTLTSNPGARHYLRQCWGDESLSERIACDINRMQEDAISHIGMVIGATNETDFFQQVTQRAPNQSLLIPGIGAQGGSVEQLEQSLVNHAGIPIVNSSRAITYAGKGLEWAHAVRTAAEQTKNSLKSITAKYVG